MKRIRPEIRESMISFPTSNVNANLTCSLCYGYFREPHTIKECLHTFCKSCVFKFVAICSKCPTCGVRLSPNPLELISHDRTLQAIINKFFPDVMLADAKAEEEFYHKLGLEPPPDSLKRVRSDLEDPGAHPTANAAHAQAQKTSSQDIRFRLQSLDANAPPLDRKFIFNAPRSAMLKKVVPFLRQWLAQHGYEDGKLCFFVDGAPVSEATTFVSLFGNTAGTQFDPVILGFEMR